MCIFNKLLRNSQPSTGVGLPSRRRHLSGAFHRSHLIISPSQLLLHCIILVYVLFKADSALFLYILKIHTKLLVAGHTASDRSDPKTLGSTQALLLLVGC